jgi:poly(beta-D-mannuronate) lyase
MWSCTRFAKCLVLICLSSLCNWTSFGAESIVANPAEFARLQKTAKPGDVLVLKNGEWTDASLVFDATGEAAKPITLRAETPGQVVFTGKSRLRIGGQHLVVEGLWFKGAGDRKDEVIEFRASSSKLAKNCRVTACAITDYNPPSKKRDYKWVSLYGVSNRVDHCYFAGKQHAGTTLVVWVGDQPNYHQIDHNHFGPRPRLGQNGGETIRVGTSEVSMNNSRTTVEFNLFQECNGEVEIISNKSCENVYRHNTFLNCEGAMTLRHGNRCVVEANYFLGNHRKYTGGVRVIGEDHRVINNYFAELGGDEARSALTLMNGLPDSPLYGYFQVKRAVIAFNTFVDCKSTILIGYVSDNPKGANLSPLDCVFANNLLVAGKTSLMKIDTAPVNWQWQGNMAQGQTGLPDTKGLSAQMANLAKDKEGIYRPQVNSPVLDAAIGKFPEVKQDIDGQPRGDSRDVGCDEVSSAVSLYRPVKKENVGPQWLKER